MDAAADDLILISEACELFDCSEWVLQKWARTHRKLCKRDALGRWLLPRDVLLAKVLAEQKRKPPPDPPVTRQRDTTEVGHAVP